jgi:membrane protease YdiL (CAAX protease family)
MENPVNHVSSERIVEDQAGAARTTVAGRTILVWTAWIATLLLSKLPLVIARDLLGSDIPWIVPTWIGTALLFFTATFLWQRLKPLRSYFAILGIILLITAWLDPLLRGTAVWSNLTAGQSEMLIIFADRIMLLLSTMIVLACLFLMGYKRRDAFLTVGNMRAHLGGRASLENKRSVTWPVIGTIMAVVLGGSFFALLVSLSPGVQLNLGAVLPWLPVILLSAGMNAFGEEAMYRAAPLAPLITPVGAVQALWMTSVWFGLGHYYGGTPSGPVGAVGSGLLGLLLGKAMLDTRGMGWSWVIHVVMDTAIYTAVAMSI